MDIGMAVQDDHDETKDGEGKRIADIAVQAVYKGVGHKGKLEQGQRSELELVHEGNQFGDVSMDAHQWKKRTFGRRMQATREDKLTRGDDYVSEISAGTVARADTLQRGVLRIGCNCLNSLDGSDDTILKEAHEHEWCVLEEVNVNSGRRSSANRTQDT